MRNRIDDVVTSPAEPPIAVLDGADAAALDRAVRQLAGGGLVAFPTETVYGLGADAQNDAAALGIFAAKGRPADHPLIVHVRGAADVPHFAGEVPEVAARLIAAFWPGPLTLILPRRGGVATATAGGQSSIGLRAPSHPVARALLEACAAASPAVRGLAAPSANRFGRVSPTRAAHVAEEFAGVPIAPPLVVLDGGACEVGIESAIVDCTRGAPVLLRPGSLTIDQLSHAAGERVRRADEAADGAVAPRASGTLEAHYAPRAKVRLMDSRQLQAALDVLGAEAKHIAVWSRAVLASRSSDIIRRRMPDDAAEVARALFAVLREFDAGGARLIWIETPPPDAAWDGVRDRLERAAAAG